MNPSLSRSLGALAVLAAVIGSNTALAKDKIVIGEQNWTGAVAIQYILGEVLQSRLDADVSYLAGDVPVLLSAASKGDGSVDVLTDIWMPNQSAAWANMSAVPTLRCFRTNSRTPASKAFTSPAICRTNTG